ncbi:MAG: hypothetical protein IPH31_23675 [Lewinellaceae bacterium]|nr:hypothetical protein [Lewinellaceae bacterium]
MKIRFRKVTNIRSDHQSLRADPIGVVYANTLLEVDGVIHEGASVKGDNRWWRDHNGWYYWAGETEAIMPEDRANIPSPTPSVIPPAAPVATAPQLPLPPAPPPPPTVPPPLPAVELIALPVPDDDHVQGGAVPTGEWRSLEESVQLVQEAPVAIAGAIVAVEGAVEVNSDFESFQTPQPAPATATATASAPAPAPAPPELLTPRVQRLNWGLELGQIPGHWWQEKRLTGRGVTLALLSTGADTQHPDLMGTPLPVFANIIENQSFGDSHGLGTQAAIVAAGRDK